MRPRSASTLARLHVLLLAGAAVVGALATTVKGAPTDDPALARAFSGTIVSTYPDGRTARLWLNADGSYAAAGRRDDRSSGRWSVKGDRVCLKQSRPIPVPFAFCTAKPAATAWKAKAFTGEPISVRLVSGGRPS